MHLPASPEEAQMKMLMHDIHGEHTVLQYQLNIAAVLMPQLNIVKLWI